MTTTRPSPPPPPPPPPPSPLNHTTALIAFFQNLPPPSQNNPLSQSISSALVIPSTSATLSSGFPYPTPLSAYDITPRDWAVFSNSIANAGRLNRKEKGLAITKGISRGVITLGGVKKCQKIAEQERKKLEVKRVLGGGGGGGGGGQSDDAGKTNMELESTLRLWNEWFFNPRGINVRVEPPRDIVGLLIHPSSTTASRHTKRRLSLDRLSLNAKKPDTRNRSESVNTVDSRNEEEEKREMLNNRFRVILMPYYNKADAGAKEKRRGKAGTEENNIPNVAKVRVLK